VTDPPEDTILLPEPVAKVQSGVRISVEPAMELIAVILSLSEHPITSHYNFAYKEDVANYFSDMAEHEAVLFIDELTRKVGELGYVPHVMALMIDRHFTLDQTAFEHLFAGRITVDINEFLSVMKAFYTDSGFEDFYLQQSDYYNSIVDAVVAVFPEWEMVAAMESFYGKKMESQNIVLCSLFWHGGFGPAIQRENGIACYSIQGPSGAKEGLPVFGSPNAFTELVLHEFGHSFVSINEDHKIIDSPDIIKARNDSAYLYEPIQDDMKSQGYTLWAIACEELLNRAVVIRLMVENQGSNMDHLLRSEINKGYIYIETVYNSLQTYADNRETYPAFSDFVPVLLSELMQAYPQE
jgi:hypothetical protein